MRRIWFTWENQRRNRELSTAFGAKLFEWVEIDDIHNPLRKYALGIYRTFATLLTARPQIVFCQNPSLILSCFLVIAKRLFRFRICVDAHNAGLFPAEGRSSILLELAYVVQRYADLSLVTNEALKLHVENNGGRAFVLPDRIPSIPVVSPRALTGRVNLLFICSYGADEPYEAVFEAARHLQEDEFVYVTGNYAKRGIAPGSLPPNVILTGYVSEDEYVRLLRSVDATIDLTTRDNCLVCGAYESVAVEKPMVLSDTLALRQYFNLGAVYAINNAEGIFCAIREVIDRQRELTLQVGKLKALRSAQWEDRLRDLEKLFSTW